MIVRIGKTYFNVKVNPTRRQSVNKTEEKARLKSQMDANWHGYATDADYVKAQEIRAKHTPGKLITDMTEEEVQEYLKSKKKNPSRRQLRNAITRQRQRGRLASAIRLELKLRKLMKNPLIKSKKKSSVSKNIRYMMHHPGELTAKTKKMKHKQAIAIALSVWRKASRK